MLLDVKAAVRWLRGHAAQFGVDPERVVLWGESAGGHLAVMAGMCTKLDGVARTGEHQEQSETPTAIVDWYGPVDLTAMSEGELEGDSEESGKTDERPEVVLGRFFPAGRGRRPRVVLYRRPVETRSADDADLADLVHEVVVEQVASALAVPPEQVDPDYRRG